MEILLVDDDEVNVIISSQMVRQGGHGVTVVANGKEAVNIMRLRSFDLILMDIFMPFMDGFEASETIRKDLRLSGKVGIPIIAVTASDIKCEEVLFNTGFEGCVQMPIQKDDLLEIISRFDLGRNCNTT